MDEEKARSIGVGFLTEAGFRVVRVVRDGFYIVTPPGDESTKYGHSVISENMMARIGERAHALTKG